MLVRLWDLNGGTELRRFAHDGMLCGVAFSPDGRRALSGGFDQVMHLWDVQTGKRLCSFPGHTDLIYSVAFAPNGQTALSSSFDKTIRLWRLPR
jgi:WD40 repeat protein